MERHFFSFLELSQNFLSFLAVLVFLPHHLEPCLSSHGGGDGGDGGASSEQQSSPHFFLHLLLCPLLMCFVHLLILEVAKLPHADGDDGGAAGSVHPQLLQSQPYSSSKYEHV